MDHDDVFHEENRHSRQFWNYGFARFHRGYGDRGTNLLFVHHRKHQAIRCIEGNGRRQLVIDGHDPVAGGAREHDWVWFGHWRRYLVWNICHVARLPACVLHAVGSLYWYWPGRRRHQYLVEPA